MSADDPNKHASDDIFPADDDAEQPDEVERQPDEEPSSEAPGERPVNGPASAAPPRVLSETPLGGIARPVVNPVPPGAQPEQDDQPEADVPDAGEDDSAADTDAPETDSTVAAVAESTGEGGADAEQPPGDAPLDVADERSPEAQIAARLQKLQARESGATSPEPGGSTSPAPPAREPEARPEPSAEPEPVAEPEEWDEDLSPELASVLFGGAAVQEPAPAAGEAAAGEVPPEQGEPAQAEPEAAAPAPVPEPDAPPVELTDIGAVRALPITAEKRAAPAPDTALDGKARYVRVEEPLDDGAGQRTLETWEYLKPAYPALNGREVREVTVEEMAYGDGSWRWRYERRYADRGRDSREVRANADRTYIERADAVSRLDPESGRRLQFEETAQLIFAGPEKEEKGGLLSGLGSLLGRGDDADEQTGPKTWRQATPSEVRQAHKDGGAAFKQGFLKGLFG